MSDFLCTVKWCQTRRCAAFWLSNFTQTYGNVEYLNGVQSNHKPLHVKSTHGVRVRYTHQLPVLHVSPFRTHAAFDLDNAQACIACKERAFSYLMYVLSRLLLDVYPSNMHPHCDTEWSGFNLRHGLRCNSTTDSNSSGAQLLSKRPLSPFLPRARVRVQAF